MKKLILSISAGMLLAGGLMSAQTRATGYYKDLFIDGSLSVTSHAYLYAERVLNLSVEPFLINNRFQTATDYELALVQEKIVGCATDENGALLYPDGAPRFRLVYEPGGTANKHGHSLTAQGQENLRTFFRNGGSYSGSCAGCILCAAGYTRRDSTDKEYAKTGGFYLHLWPGYITMTNLFDTPTALSVEKDCPLLKYYDFGGDNRVDSVKHNGGCYMTAFEMPEGTEPLLRFIGDTLKLKRSIDKEIAVYAYKPDSRSGRMVPTGSHPEIIPTGERLQMFASMLHYALDGNGEPQVKAALVNGEAREMTLGTKDNKPEFTAIGDKQYHHFTVDVPKGAKKVVVDLKSIEGRSNYDLFLYAAPGQFAFNDVAKWMNVGTGVDKELVITNPKAGKLYVSVYCYTTVDAVRTKNGYQYTGRVDVLNGVPYIITATVEK